MKKYNVQANIKNIPVGIFYRYFNPYFFGLVSRVLRSTVHFYNPINVCPWNIVFSSWVSTPLTSFVLLVIKVSTKQTNSKSSPGKLKKNGNIYQLQNAHISRKFWAKHLIINLLHVIITYCTLTKNLKHELNITN